jgi:diacylglycerol kinase family enzyme
MKGLFIINPSSGRQNFKENLTQIAGKLIMDQIASTIDVFYTEQKNDAKNRVAVLKKGEYDFVVAVGGDGTLNEVVNGLIISESETPLAIISSGTVNDFATYLHLPSAAEVENFCDMIRNFKLKDVDAGKIKRLLFVYDMQIAVVRHAVQCTRQRIGGGGKLCFVKDIMIIQRNGEASGNLFGKVARILLALGIRCAQNRDVI